MLIEPKELIKAIQQFHLDEQHKFPFNVLVENTLIIESLIQIKAYWYQNTYNFIIQVPIVETVQYQLYNLYPIPIIIKNKTYMIENNYNYIAIGKDDYLLINKQCKEIIPNQYLCTEQTKQKSKDQCEFELVTQSKIQNCAFKRIESQSLTFIETPQMYVIISNKEQKLREQCNKNVKYHVLLGTYIIKKSNDCKYQINEIIIQNYETILKEYQFYIGIINVTNSEKHSIVKLKEINIELQEKHLNLEHNNTAHYVILYFVIVIVLILSVIKLRKYYLKRKLSRSLKIEDKSSVVLQDKKSELKEGGVMW
ncbi:uncharacterized protein [Onthophagus taurus]|uniref:uncharacterized protein n=1 Tax=Onthophagus taurus TaxID=166361 RepID=UPI0039BE4A7C